MSLDQVHHDASEGTTAGARAALFLKGFASRIQNECNNRDFAAIRELCVQVAQRADDFALTIEHGWDEAETMREEERERAQGRAARNETQQVVPSVNTPREMPAHAGPTDVQAAPTPKTAGTVPAQPTTGERAQSAPNPDGPAAGQGSQSAKEKEQHGTVAGARTAADAPQKPGETKEQAAARETREKERQQHR